MSDESQQASCLGHTAYWESILLEVTLSSPGGPSGFLQGLQP